MESKKQPTIMENVLWQYANQYLGEQNVKMLTDEKNRPYLKYGGLLFLAVYLIFGHLAQLISNLVGFLYPAYCSVKALESSTKADDTKWLTYWVVFATFSLIDTFSGFILSWLPFYWLAKVLFLVWCFSSSDFNGSTVIYNKVILPFFKKHEKKIDSAMGRVDRVVASASREAEKITENIRTDL
ncbi:receptor expression-enhancing protein 5 isoform X2 [Hyalella azteca]|uniref:Receptor expression-enhancing protein n=1 Tax=Hyalella azteca TaxID=294128 RepID=A0A8B7NAC3_HYAAZ|nr:receptor expression-enhancing protein 5 isoform X2 [Hyalella azteca]